jgi:hypothetical protein
MNRVQFGDCRTTMRAWTAAGVKAQTCVTSPPYFGRRDYGHDGQIGLEDTPDEFVAAMVEVFRCVREFYAQGEHFHFDRAAWDTVSGEPQNYWCDEEGTATVEDGTIAKLAIDAEMKGTP